MTLYVCLKTYTEHMYIETQQSFKDMQYMVDPLDDFNSNYNNIFIALNLHLKKDSKTHYTEKAEIHNY